ncbi:MAG: hypothetical protein EA370_12810 [Wenzhouxiangella sp.]|nr:MAG: hypothetical protein EA370_12810 [Wenzhouxiangella sp.]
MSRTRQQRRQASPKPDDRRPETRQSMSRRRWSQLAAVLFGVLLLGAGWTWWQAEQFEDRFDADYVGSAVCGDCHTIVHGQWLGSPHANMVRRPDTGSVVGDFNAGEFRLPADSPDPLAGEVVARTFVEDERYYMALRHPDEESFVAFPIEYVVGYQYRQEYVFREPDGVLRRLPLQWSTAKQAYFPYWNLQEGSDQTLDDLWAQMTTLHSAWNLYCARCHTTNMDILERDPGHTRARVEWQEKGIGCEACHGPGSLHVEYMKSNAANRLAMFVRNHLHGHPVAYVANADKLPKEQALSVCARCHGADIFTHNQDFYRLYEPGYSRSGRINDLSEFFRQAPLTPGRMDPTVEVWHNGRPRGIGMLFRSFVESECYDKGEPRCYDCHDPHQNKAPTRPGILEPSAVSNAYCSSCHTDIRNNPEAHTHHAVGSPGSFCYDCHMPKHITKLNTGIWERTRTHEMSSLPNPHDSVRFGLDNAPNACSDCHTDSSPADLVEVMREWWPAYQPPESPEPDIALY